jgi:alkanesulfonate monooxygenase SsuD/methylene tetrahydromethanopterin reductase-like flavin-dependent oxidoreductase (luciferase family)
MNLAKKLGITLSYDYIPPQTLNELLPIISDSNFTHIFIPEIWGRDAFSQVAEMARHTDLTLCTGIVNLYSRTPATLAQTAASLHDLTKEKFILGLGLSGPIVIQDWHGINYHTPSPLQRTREYLEILRLIFSGDRVNYSGEIFTLKRFKLNFETPLEVPIFLAAIGPRNVQLAGELADGWLPIWTSFTISRKSSIHPKIDLEKGFTKRDPNLRKDFDIAPYIITCASKSEVATVSAQKHLAYYIGGMGDFYYLNMKRLGFQKEVDRIKMAWKAGERDLSAKAVTQDMLEKLVILGEPEDVVFQYDELKKQGVTIPVVMPPFNCPPDLVLDTIRAFQ